MLEQMIADRGFNPEHVAARFCRDRVYGIGSAVRQFIANHRATLAEVVTMFTYCVRGERFSDGHWAAMLESGKVVALLKRLCVLREQMR